MSTTRQEERSPSRKRRRKRQSKPVPRCAFCLSGSVDDRCDLCGAECCCVPAPESGGDAQVQIGYRPDGRFGVAGYPSPASRALTKLTFSDDGATNNTRLRIGSATPLLGKLSSVRRLPRPSGKCPSEIVGVWERGTLRITQRLTIVTGPTTQARDTVRVDYLVWNRWNRRRKDLGLRVMLDTLIGSNDGVPFVVSGKQGILTHSEEYRGASVPNFVQAIEREDAVDPGTVVHLGLRGCGATPPDRLVIDHWPGSQANYEFFQGRGVGWGRDSAVGLYWDPFELAAGEARVFTFFYGLGGMSSVASGNRRLSLTSRRRVEVGERFRVSARVFSPQPQEIVRLHVPEGLSLVGESERVVSLEAAANFTFLDWEVVATESGRHTLVVRADGAEESQAVSVVRG